MGYFIVEDDSGEQHFVEAQLAGMAFGQVINAVSVRIASQNDIEEQILKGRLESDPKT